MAEQKHAFTKLTELIEDYKNNKDSFDASKLQSLREDIALTLFYLSDSASQSIANYDAAEHVRKSKMAEREQFYRNDTDNEGKRITATEAQNLARIDCKEEVEKSKNALRQKERVRIILNSTNQILNALASRISQIQ